MLTFAIAGELRHIQKLRFWPLAEVLHDKYLLPKEEADLIASFLNPMLRLVPEKRAKASELIHHAWLDGVVVQGEVDVIRRAEEEDARRRAAAARSRSRRASEEDPDGDAMKPVDESAPSPVEDEAEAGAPVTSSAAGKENAHAHAKENVHAARGVPTLHTVPHPPHSKGAGAAR